MRIPEFSREARVAFNMTPMIDVVFLLIIFFLLSSHLVRRESQLALPLPASETGESQWDETAPRVTLNLLPDGAILLAGRRTTPEELVERLSRARVDTSDDLEVRIRADRNVAYRHVSPLLIAAAKAGIWNVTFAVVRPEDVAS